MHHMQDNSNNTATQKSPITPLGDRVIVRPLAERMTPSGIVIPDSTNKEKPGMGSVIAVGTGRRTDDGKIVPIGVSVGDTILFSKYSPDEITFDGQDLLVLREDSILAIVK